jgi:hypothetical protein
MFGIIALWKQRIIKFLATIALFSILFILGDNFILYKLFYDFIPGFDKFRYLGRFGLVLPFSFSLLSAYGFDYFINNVDSEKVKKFIKYFTILVSVFILLWLLFQLGLFKNMTDVYKDEKFYDNSVLQLLKTVVILLVLLGLVILYNKTTKFQHFNTSTLQHFNTSTSNFTFFYISSIRRFIYIWFTTKLYLYRYRNLFRRQKDSI